MDVAVGHLTTIIRTTRAGPTTTLAFDGHTKQLSYREMRMPTGGAGFFFQGSVSGDQWEHVKMRWPPHPNEDIEHVAVPVGAELMEKSGWQYRFGSRWCSYEHKAWAYMESPRGHM